jgi:ribulose 1,5-bisphosphate synthetase/thiazole synthase
MTERTATGVSNTSTAPIRRRDEMSEKFKTNARDRRPSDSARFDVLVAGGGAAGVAAAVTAARQGLKVVLVERYGFCGGGAVAGMSGTICGLYAATQRKEAKPEKIIHGFVDDFIAAMESKGGLGGPLRYGYTYTRVHDPLIWREAADALLEAAGVQILYHAAVIAVLIEGSERVMGAVVATKKGILNIEAEVTIDASGDADLVEMAGFETRIGLEGRVQNPTMIFRLGGVDVERFWATYGPDTIMPPAVTEAIVSANASGGYRLPRTKIWLFPTTRPSELLCNCTRVTGRDGRELMTLDPMDFTEAEIEGRRQVREYARFFRSQLAGCESSHVIDTGVQVGVRQTRQIEGRQRLLNQQVLTGAKFPDGIARSPWPIELHSGAKPKVEWLFDNYYEVPFGVFQPTLGSGLLAAGRCLSAEHEAVASARVTAQCFAYGEAVGHAAVMAIREHIPTEQIDGRDVRQRLPFLS